MKDRIIQTVLQKMLPHLNNEQMKLLQETLSHALYGVTIAETEEVAKEGELDVLTAFVTAKRIWGIPISMARIWSVITVARFWNPSYRIVLSV